MEIVFSPRALDDLKHWRKSGNQTIQKKIEKLIIAIQENPYEGIGKPEQLKHNLSGAWSRRITQEHRLVYEINEQDQLTILDILSLKGHY
ncbi:Txe/YoeB family addiction module toxin [Mucilaginibacter dorajii]|uniref:Putative mRNA interferase YoeB n=1 Tax=Mucilaginibacter dorajii TaxID=692994 RepID=A0ABP7QSF4_9SPHI|nr:Txe/YoeB family addiction module toxin [Mucilaginibacter dorajii]MCS3736203.1 toxin YoeB [Mucilaginibacter dorajii]